MKRMIFAFSAVAMVFMWGKSEAAMVDMVDKSMHRAEMHDGMKMAKKMSKEARTKKDLRDHAETLFAANKERLDVHKKRIGAMMETKRNEFYKPVKKAKKMMKAKGDKPMVKKMMKKGDDNAVLFSMGGVWDKTKKAAKKIKDTGKKAASKAMKLAEKHGPKAVELVKKHGPKAMDLVKKHGPEAISWMHEHGPKAIKGLIDRHGDRLVGMAMDHGPKVMDAVKKYGPTAMDIIGKGGKAALEMMMK